MLSSLSSSRIILDSGLMLRPLCAGAVMPCFILCPIYSFYRLMSSLHIICIASLLPSRDQALSLVF